MANNNFRQFEGGIRIIPMFAVDPTGDAKVGEIYYNSAANVLRVCVQNTPTVIWEDMNIRAGTVNSSTLRWNAATKAWIENVGLLSNLSTLSAPDAAGGGTTLNLAGGAGTVGNASGGDVRIVGGSGVGTGLKGRIIADARNITGLDGATGSSLTLKGGDSSTASTDGADILLIGGTPGAGGRDGRVSLAGRSIQLNAQGTADPATPSVLDLYYNTVEVRFKYFTGTAWKALNSEDTVGVNLKDDFSTTLPPTTATLIDGQTVFNGFLVLFTALSSGNNTIYQAAVDGFGNITWTTQVFWDDPTGVALQGDIVAVSAGSLNGQAFFGFTGSTWAPLGVPSASTVDATLRWNGSQFTPNVTVLADAAGRVYGKSDSVADAVAALDFTVQAGAKTAGTGDGGGVLIEGGASFGGARGRVELHGGRLRLNAQLAADPSVGNAATDVYYNTVENRFKYYDGSNWRALGSGAGGGAPIQFWDTVKTTLPATNSGILGTTQQTNKSSLIVIETDFNPSSFTGLAQRFTVPQTVTVQSITLNFTTTSASSGAKTVDIVKDDGSGKPSNLGGDIVASSANSYVTGTGPFTFTFSSPSLVAGAYHIVLRLASSVHSTYGALFLDGATTPSVAATVHGWTAVNQQTVGGGAWTTNASNMFMTFSIGFTGPLTVDGQFVNSGDIVLFTALSSSNNRPYKATISGPSITWQAQLMGQDPSGAPTPGDQLYIERGDVNYDKLTVYRADTLAWAHYNDLRSAKTDLSNLNPRTSINAALLPDADGTRDLGSQGGFGASLAEDTTRRWRNAYLTGTLYTTSILSSPLDFSSGAMTISTSGNGGGLTGALNLKSGDGATSGNILIQTGGAYAGNRGKVILDGFLSNLASGAASDPVSGMSIRDVYYNTTENRYKYYDGTNWRALGGGSGVAQAQYIDTASTTLPTTPPFSPDGTAVVTGDIVLFTALTNPAQNNRLYKATVTGSIVWTLQIAGQDPTGAPADGDAVYIQKGTVNADQLYFYTGTAWVNYGGNFANKTLSNLTSPTAINQNLTFAAAGAARLVQITAPGAGISGSALQIRAQDSGTGTDLDGGTALIAGGASTGNGGSTIQFSIARPLQGAGTTARGFQRAVQISDNNELRMYEPGTTSYVGIRAPASTTSYTVQLPAVAPTAGQILIATSATATTWQTGAFANQALSNLTNPTAINQNLLPGVTNTIDLGSSALAYKDLYISGTQFLGTAATNVQMLPAATQSNPANATTTLFTYTGATFPTVWIDYQISRNGIVRMGTLMVAWDGTTLSQVDTANATGATGTSLSATQATGTITISAVVDNSSGVAAQVKYWQRRM